MCDCLGEEDIILYLMCLLFMEFFVQPLDQNLKISSKLSLKLSSDFVSQINKSNSRKEKLYSEYKRMDLSRFPLLDFQYRSIIT